MGAEKTVWEVAQQGERAWWFGGVHDNARAYEEQEKQVTYAEKMGLELLADGTYDLGGKSVLDIGGGPVSLLLKCKNFRTAIVVDPMDMPDWVTRRYSDAGIRYMQMKGEDYSGHDWDEVWLYNVLLHAESPQKIIEKAKNAGKIIRIFEWINTVKNDIHPHTLTRLQLDAWLECDGKVEAITYGNNYSTDSYSAVVESSRPSEVALVGCDVRPSVNGDIIGERGEEGSPGIHVRHKRFHLLGLPHVATNQKEALACAFSQKVIKMARMLKSLGHTVFFYGVEGSEVECDEFIEVSTQALLKEVYTDYDMTKVTYKHNPKDRAYTTFNANTIPQIQSRMESNDFLLIPFSPAGYKQIIDTLDAPHIECDDKIRNIVEMGIGYRGTYCRYKVFESVSQMHYNYGLEGVRGDMNQLWYNTVIPNYFEPDDFEYSDTKDDYFLFLGRVVHRKGVVFAIETVEAIGAKLIIAGQSGEEGVNLGSPNVEYVGFADHDTRKRLLRDAKGLFLPTQYIEPFGGVIIEAALSGTPVITTNWGAFPELVEHGVTGYRCQTLDHLVWAAQNIGNIKPIDCYNYAINNFSLDRVRWMYEEYFNMLLDVQENIDGKGWHRLHPERENLDWLHKVR